MKNLSQVREDIIEAAERHFSLLGFEKTTLDDITSSNGKSKTSIYYHFKNKHEIFKTVVDKEFKTVREDIQKAIDKYPQDRIGSMKAYLRTRLESLQHQGAFKRFASSRFAYGDNAVSKVVAEARKPFDDWERGFIEQSVIQGHREGSIPPGISPEVFASTLVNMLKALELQFFSSEDKSDVAETYKGMIELIVR